jgi:hypothetical protein
MFRNNEDCGTLFGLPIIRLADSDILSHSNVTYRRVKIDGIELACVVKALPLLRFEIEVHYTVTRTRTKYTNTEVLMYRKLRHRIG